MAQKRDRFAHSGREAAFYDIVVDIAHDGEMIFQEFKKPLHVVLRHLAFHLMKVEFLKRGRPSTQIEMTLRNKAL